MRHLAAQARAALEEHLRRHPAVCEKVGKHPNIAENLAAALVAGGGHRCVLDRWEAGESLAQRLESAALPELDLKIVMTGKRPIPMPTLQTRLWSSSPTGSAARPQRRRRQPRCLTPDP